MLIVVLIVGLVIVGVAAWAFAAYNGLIKKRNGIENAYGQIDVQLTRRHDLVPNLVETVKGYAAHERETLEAVINARNRAVSAAGSADAPAAENALSSVLGSLFALSESYPDLKANQNFQQLQGELTATEDRIAHARQYFNDLVRRYNDSTETFPSVLIAKRFGFDKRRYFETEDEQRSTPDVSFDSP